MANIIIKDESGETYQSSQFVAVILQENGQVLGLAEAGNLSQEESLAFLIQGTKLFGELASSITPGDVTENPLPENGGSRSE